MAVKCQFNDSLNCLKLDENDIIEEEDNDNDIIEEENDNDNDNDNLTKNFISMKCSFISDRLFFIAFVGVIIALCFILLMEKKPSLPPLPIIIIQKENLNLEKIDNRYFDRRTSGPIFIVDDNQNNDTFNETYYSYNNTDSTELLCEG